MNVFSDKWEVLFKVHVKVPGTGNRTANISILLRQCSVLISILITALQLPDTRPLGVWLTRAAPGVESSSDQGLAESSPCRVELEEGHVRMHTCIHCLESDFPMCKRD